MTSEVIQVLERARQAARGDGRPRFVSAVAHPPRRDAILEVEDHERIMPDGTAVAVYPVPG